MSETGTDPVEPTPERTRRGARTKRLAIAAAVAVMISGGGAVALAATGDDERGPGGRGMPPGVGMYQGTWPGGSGRGQGPPGRLDGLPGVLHGRS